MTVWLSLLLALTGDVVEPAESAGTPPTTLVAESVVEAAAPPRRNYFVPSRSIGTRREPEPPPYVRNIRDIEWFDTEDDWLDLGVDYRMRYEYRHNDLRRPVPGLDEPFLLRTRVYIGVRERFDPLRGYIEFEDARRYHSQFPEDVRDVNENEIIQAVGELYFADAVNGDRPLRLQAGRFAFEYADRRLIARNAWRNTTNTFQGARVILGEESDNWQIDLLALQPIDRLMTQFDQADNDRWFFGALGEWREWSDVVTLEPYYLILDQNGSGNRSNRHIHTAGLRGYGVVPETSYDFDLQQIIQYGRNDGLPHFALAATAEIGYTYDQPSKPRVSAFSGYASGDQNPYDNRSGRFERLFGFARPWSSDDYITFDNIITQKFRFEINPHSKIRIDAGYSHYWLANRRDIWLNTQLQDPTGNSGRYMGQELDLRIRIAATNHLDVTLGYAHFLPGGFTRRTGKPWTSDFFYVELSPRLFQ